MTSRTVVAMIAALALAGCGDEGGSAVDAGTDGGADADTDGWDPRFDAFAEALQEELAASDAYGVSAAVMEGGVVTFAAAFGAKDPEGLEPLTPDTLMQIGSTTKQMTAAALLGKVEDGLIELDDTLEESLPELEFALDATWDDQITVHHLLSHQGGFFDWIPWDGPAADSELVDYTYDAFDDEYWLMSPPGAFWNYSNPNFVFAGLLAETLDARPWPDIMAEDLFAPLGMARSFLRKTEVEADGDYALSYGLGVDDLVTGIMGPVAMADVPDPGWARPAGLAWTTPTQMMAWAGFLMDGDPAVLSDDLRAEITTAQVDTLYGAGSMAYGYGEFVETGYWALDGSWYETPVWEHGGNTLSFTNIFYVLPEHDFAVAICSSAYSTDFSHALDVAITTLVDLPEPSAPPEYEIDPAQFDRHVGTYDDPYNVGEMIVAREGDALLVEMPVLELYGLDVAPELTPVSSEIFILYIDGYGYDLTFVPLAEGGQSEYARNRSFVPTRVEGGGKGARAAPSRAEVERCLRRARLTPSPVRIAPPR
jgi:CubicO group peptidase (beta-lactamase class C family)